jgi:membrane protein YdbS with pleckstrin-like domain
MNHVRGFVMLLAAATAAWRGWKIHTGTHAWMAYGLAALALGMAVWHLTRKPDAPRL